MTLIIIILIILNNNNNVINFSFLDLGEILRPRQIKIIILIKLKTNKGAATSPSL